MTKSKKSVKGPKESFATLPKDLLLSQAFLHLSGNAVKLLIYLLAHYNGYNNGSLSACWRVLKFYGWRSPATLSRAIRELIESGFIIKTRQGGKNKTSLFALTFKPINECSLKSATYDAGITIGECTWQKEITEDETVHEEYDIDVDKF